MMAEDMEELDVGTFAEAVDSLELALSEIGNCQQQTLNALAEIKLTAQALDSKLVELPTTLSDAIAKVRLPPSTPTVEEEDETLDSFLLWYAKPIVREVARVVAYFSKKTSFMLESTLQYIQSMRNKTTTTSVEMARSLVEQWVVQVSNMVSSLGFVVRTTILDNLGQSQVDVDSILDGTEGRDGLGWLQEQVRSASKGWMDGILEAEREFLGDAAHQAMVEGDGGENEGVKNAVATCCENMENLGSAFVVRALGEQAAQPILDDMFGGEWTYPPGYYANYQEVGGLFRAAAIVSKEWQDNEYMVAIGAQDVGRVALAWTLQEMLEELAGGIREQVEIAESKISTFVQSSIPLVVEHAKDFPKTCRTSA